MRSRAINPLLAGVLALVVGGCDEPSTAEDLLLPPASSEDDEDSAGSEEPDRSTDPVSLVDMEAWVVGDEDDDPFADEQPERIECPTATWGIEWGRLEVQTGACNYFHVVQPSLARIDAGDSIEIVAFHDRLDAAEPSSGHLALWVDDEVIWERTVPIPAEATVIEERVTADEDWPAGAMVGLHLHNHGYNAWTVVDVAVVPGG